MLAQGGSASGKRDIPTTAGLREFDRLAHGIVSENKSNYNDKVEEELFQTNIEVRMLLKSLEKKTDEVQT